MEKSVYRIDLSEDEFNNFENLNFSELKSKFKKIIVSQKKIDSIKRAGVKRTLDAYYKYLRACIYLLKNNTPITYYNLKKYNKTNLSTHKKFEEMMKKDLVKIEFIKNCYGFQNEKNSYFERNFDGDIIVYGWYVPLFGNSIEEFMENKSFDDVDVLNYYNKNYDVKDYEDGFDEMD